MATSRHVPAASWDAEFRCGSMDARFLAWSVEGRAVRSPTKVKLSAWSHSSTPPAPSSCIISSVTTTSTTSRRPLRPSLGSSLRRFTGTMDGSSSLSGSDHAARASPQSSPPSGKRRAKAASAASNVSGAATAGADEVAPRATLKDGPASRRAAAGSAGPQTPSHVPIAHSFRKATARHGRSASPAQPTALPCDSLSEVASGASGHSIRAPAIAKPDRAA
mmetsp:Transcript_13496/g.37341  ORF Transcript_13496/g.37341 Transcript_13496/m.37341 type:complete len:220 (-) Transcript_13496:1073-1732(-)